MGPIEAVVSNSPWDHSTNRCIPPSWNDRTTEMLSPISTSLNMSVATDETVSNTLAQIGGARYGRTEVPTLRGPVSDSFFGSHILHRSHRNPFTLIAFVAAS